MAPASNTPSRNWSLGFEYDHLFMGNKDINSATGFLIADHIEEDVDLFSARLNYKFGGPAVGPLLMQSGSWPESSGIVRGFFSRCGA